MKKNINTNALITPLSSIFGSGFLIIVPILAAAVGRYSVFAMAIVCLVAYLVGHVIRFNIKNVEPLIDNNQASKKTKSLEWFSNVFLVPAYIISVTLYLKIFAAFALEPFKLDTQINENILVTVVLIVILVIAIIIGLDTLGFLEKISLFITLGIILLLFVGFFSYDLNALQTGITWPTPANESLFTRIQIISGSLIVVQGFETTRYLSYKFDTNTRIKACRNSQIISTVVYIIFVLLATPLTFNLNLQGAVHNNDLITLARVASPLLVLPLVFAAMLSQFSAAIADAFAASGNIKEESENKLSVKKGTIIVVSFAGILTWIVDDSSIVTLASKAFAIYYFVQCLTALSVVKRKRDMFLFIGLLFILAFIVIFSVPVG